jgi:hypothetical protein
MPFDLSLPAYAAFAIAGIALLSRFGWPQLRLRTYNEVHGGLRIIEIALSLSRAGAAGGAPAPRIFEPILAAGRAARRTFQGALQRLALGAAVPAAVQKNVDTNRRERLLMEAQPEVQKAAPAAIDRAAGAGACAECVVYVTLKFRNS